MAEPNPQAPLWQHAVVAPVRALLVVLRWLPRWLAQALAIGLAVPWAGYWALRDRRGKQRAGYHRNIAIAFRSGSPMGSAAPRGHLWRWSLHLAYLLFDSCRLPRLTANNLERHIDMREFPRLLTVMRRGKGLICATGHVGVWDVAGVAASLAGMPLTSVFRPSPLLPLNRLIERLRTHSGQVVVAKQNVLKTLRKVLTDQQAVGILADGGGKHSAVFAPFLGTLASTVASPALLQLQTNAPIAVVAVLRTGFLRYRMRVFDVIEPAASGDRAADLLRITTRINQGLQQALAEAPEQWFWHSRRFRHRPQGEVAERNGLPPLA